MLRISSRDPDGGLEQSVYDKVTEELYFHSTEDDEDRNHLN